MSLIKKIGLYFGSFNPPHIGHILIARYAVEKFGLDEVRFIVSPHNPLKKEASLASAEIRYEMVVACCGNDAKFRPSDIEFNLPKPSYTAHTLRQIKDKAKDSKERYFIVLGQDSLNNLYQWKNYEYILSNFQLIAYPRIYNRENKWTVPSEARVKFLLNAPIMGLSSTEIRNRVKHNLDISYMVAEGVNKIISRYKLYR